MPSTSGDVVLHVTRGMFALMACALLPSWAMAQAKSPPIGPRWSSTLREARDEAELGSRLLMFVLAQPGDEVSLRELYADRRVARDSEGVAALIGAADDHRAVSSDPETLCSVFGSIRCRDHQALGEEIRRHLFGDHADTGQLEHVLAYPDGSIAWHKVGKCEAGELSNAIRTAKDALAKSVEYRQRKQQDALRKLMTSAHRDGIALHVAFTMLAQAPSDCFAELWKVVSNRPAAESLLRELALLPADRASPRVAAVLRTTGDTSAGLARKLFAEIQQHKTPVAAPTLPVMRLTDTLPSLGDAEPLDVLFEGDPRPTIERGRITVLLFFLPEWSERTAYAARYSAFARDVRNRGVNLIALAPVLEPKKEAFPFPAEEFDFPAGVYTYVPDSPFLDVKEFPTAVVIDPGLHVVYRSSHYTEFESLVRGMLALPKYLEQMTGVAASR